MSDNRNSLLAQLDAVIEKETFSATALKGIEALRSRVELQEKALQASKDAEQNSRTQLANAQHEVDRLRLKETKFEEAVVARGKLELEVAVAKAKSDVWQECFRIIFANRQVREHTNRNIPMKDQYGSTQWASENTDITREER